MPQQNRILEMTASIVSGLVAGRPSLAEDVPAMLDLVHEGLKRLEAGGSAQVASPGPHETPVATETLGSGSAAHAGDIRDLDRETGYARDGVVTVTSDHIVCLDDGRSVVFLKRHLKSIGVQFADYLKRHGLPEDYPTTAPAYVAEKRRLAKAQGLGKSLRASGSRPSKSGKSAEADGKGRLSGTLSASF